MAALRDGHQNEGIKDEYTVYEHGDVAPDGGARFNVTGPPKRPHSLYITRWEVSCQVLSLSGQIFRWTDGPDKPVLLV